MKRISDAKFVEIQPNKDKVIAIRIKNEKFYFLGWMENAEHYAIQLARNPYECQIDKGYIMLGSIFKAIESCEGYNNMVYAGEVNDIIFAWEEKDTKTPKSKDEFSNPYDEFLFYVNNYRLHGVYNKSDHDIFILSNEELSDVCDALRDGDYIFIINDSNGTEGE